MLQPPSASEQLVRILPASTQANDRPFAADSGDYGLASISNTGLFNIQCLLARLPTSDE